MKRVYITYAQIKALKPCVKELRKVKRWFGTRRRVRVTERVAVAVAGLFDFNWLAIRTLSHSAWRAYDETRATARRAYGEATATAWARAYISQ